MAMTSSALLQRELNDVGVGFIKRRFTIRQIELPESHETGFEFELHHLGFLSHEVMAPAAQGLCVIGAKLQFINHFQAGQFGLTSKL